MRAHTNFRKTLLFTALTAMLFISACGDPACEQTLTCKDTTNGSGGSGGQAGSGGGQTSTGGAGGGALSANGTTCTAPGECLSGECTEGVCCNSACEDACYSCATADNAGSCLPATLDTDPKDNCAGLAMCNGAGACRYGEHIFSAGFGGGGHQQISEMAIDADGNVVVAGIFAGQIDFGGDILQSAGGYDVFLAKFSPSGQHLWSQRYGDSGDEEVNAVAVDANNNIALVGRYSGTIDFGGATLVDVGGGRDAFLAKFSPIGSHVWSKSFVMNGGDFFSGAISDVAMDSQGGILISGITGLGNELLDLGQGSLLSVADGDEAASYVAKFSASGTLSWQRVFKQTSAEDSAVHFTTIDVGIGGDVLLGGGFWDGADFGGVSFTHPRAGFVARLNTDGAHEVSTAFPWSGSRFEVRSVASMSNGGMVVVGDMSGSVVIGSETYSSIGGDDVFAAVFAPDGSVAWAEAFGSLGTDRFFDVAVDSFDNFVVVGYARGAIDLGGGLLMPAASTTDLLAAKFDASGNHIWSWNQGNPDRGETGRAIAIAGDDTIAIAGAYGGEWSLGGATLLNNGGSDAFFALFTP